jgi:GTPase SAR1 family protein
MHRLIETDSTANCKQFNIMVVGPAGVGKSSFVEMFLQKFNLEAF